MAVVDAVLALFWDADISDNSRPIPKEGILLGCLSCDMLYDAMFGSSKWSLLWSSWCV